MAHSVKAPRRIGAPDAKNRTLLLDAAEQLMLEEGYAAVSSRRVAEKAGLKHQLVHYYFRTMDDLFLAAFRRRGDQGLEEQARALKSTQPLWALWRFSTDPAGTALTTQFIALAHHRKELKAEIARYAEQLRAEQCQAVADIIERSDLDTDECPAVVMMVLMTSVSRVLVMEQEALGMTAGHAETVAFVEHWLRRLEGEPQSS
ncbi:TetR/AcrR family transcriptional regulator [Mycobacterium talmoniae]|uniref:HTH-type transcriptional regulator BetI n=1 Tax=Mycobacterium talmoniae TaxID=1858794 RepID=A0A1S1NJS5_9MYCO|nr:MULTISPECIES: TetR/AcrR family transcriptional regulator [Mycobacterium]OHV06431.1 TetR family transcriptional regulator [Mycobacterium talmoniae]PQM49031.1 HTH-type transcriptional regulator BetI [Mycobacterium talmoniae]TDH57383.1 TetR/AcrR family transcriptional regulator [Mycobacterium eburneum]